MLYTPRGEIIEFNIKVHSLIILRLLVLGVLAKRKGGFL